MDRQPPEKLRQCGLQGPVREMEIPRFQFKNIVGKGKAGYNLWPS